MADHVDYLNSLPPATLQRFVPVTDPAVLAEAAGHDYWYAFHFRGETYIRTFDGVRRVLTFEQARQAKEER